MTARWQVLGASQSALGESPFWHPAEQALYWVDITGQQLLRAQIAQGTVQRWQLPSEPGCIAPAASGGLVVALRDGVFRARHWGGPLQWLATLPYDPASVRANDGKCDALGRFWIGTVDESKTHQAAALYCLQPGTGPLQVEQKADQALTANGLAWSPSADTLYWADTPRHRVHAWDYDLQRNVLSGHRIHHQFDPKPANWSAAERSYIGRPDGAAVDSEGNYWVAMYEGSRLCKLSPQGILLEQLEVPTQCPTMPCFGGEDLRTLYLTSAQHRHNAGLQGNSQADTQAGAVFFTRVEVPGLAVNFYQDAVF